MSDYIKLKNEKRQIKNKLSVNKRLCLVFLFDYCTIIKKERDFKRNAMAKGGVRLGAGRPLGSGKFNGLTKAVRLPMSEIENIFRYIQNKFYRLPFYQHTVSAGFPSPAEDEIEDRLDLNELLIKHPSATFYLRVSGTSMIKVGIHHGDILIVDRSLVPTNGKIVIASINGELTVKRLVILEGNRVQLHAENDAYRPIEITEAMELCIWGVVTNVIHSL